MKKLKLYTKITITALSGFSLLELLIVMLIVGVLAGIGIPTYKDIMKESETNTAIEEIRGIEERLEKFFIFNNRYPADEAELGGLPLDPWGNPYVYLNIALQNGKGKLRKDHECFP